MKAPNITPDKWRLAIYNYRAEITNGGLPIANVQACHDIRWEENARLIAAAPQMAEALERLLRVASVELAKTHPNILEQAKTALLAAGYTES